MMWLGLIRMRVIELWIPPRLPSVSVSGTSMRRSWEWYMYTVPSGIRCDTIARAATTPLRLTSSIQSLSAMPTFSASCTLIHTCCPPRERFCMNQLSWYWLWIAHLKCGVR